MILPRLYPILDIGLLETPGKNPDRAAVHAAARRQTIAKRSAAEPLARRLDIDLLEAPGENPDRAPVHTAARRQTAASRTTEPLRRRPK